jgi:magnesium chelatase subunit D
MPQHYPFTAVVGADPDHLDDMALALVLTTITPAIGGVLVRGEKGTAKSTLVRALAAVLPPIDVVAGDRFSSDPADPAPLSPDGPFGPDAGVETRPVRLVELPVGATEDRVLGSLDLEQALGSGVTRYEPGLLARAHRGVLYVDEVNLLHDHLVDLLLDAAAMGRSTVERDGVSVEHAARFVLIGTMNPEEGELRPQLLDRFGLAVEVAAPRDPQARAEVVRRRLAFDADPAGFAARFADAEAALTERIRAAQQRVVDVVLDDDTLVAVAELCSAFGVDGLRADIVTARTAAAHAAWHGRTTITRDDLRAAARLALPHRRRRNPFDETGLDQDQLDDLLPPEQPDGDGPPDDGGPDDGPDDGGPGGGPDGGGSGDTTQSSADAPATPPGPSAGDAPEGSGQAAESTVGAGQPVRARLLQVDGVGAGVSGRRSRAVTDDGRRIGARAPEGRSGSLHLVETVRAAAPHQHARGRTDGGRLRLHGSDLRVAVREGRESNLVLLCVDASGSMAARRRMEQVKTAVLSLLLDAYQRRDKVGLVTFRGASASLDLPPTSSVDVAARRLEELPAGGRTPLAEGLASAADALRLEAVRDPLRRPLLVVVTDGRATSGGDALGRAHRVADHLRATGVASVVVDCETGGFRMGLAAVLADRLGAQHLPLGEVSADALTSVVRSAQVGEVA